MVTSEVKTPSSFTVGTVTRRAVLPTGKRRFKEDKSDAATTTGWPGGASPVFPGPAAVAVAAADGAAGSGAAPADGAAAASASTSAVEVAIPQSIK
jgi:hypothetical protein